MLAVHRSCKMKQTGSRTAAWPTASERWNDSRPMRVNPGSKSLKHGNQTKHCARRQGGCAFVFPRDFVIRCPGSTMHFSPYGIWAITTSGMDPGHGHCAFLRSAITPLRGGHRDPAQPGQKKDSIGFVNEILAGSKYLATGQIRRSVPGVRHRYPGPAVDFRVGTDVESSESTRWCAATAFRLCATGR